MNYRPITDTWPLTRPKLKGGRKYYGAYPCGFPERARVLIGVPLDEPLLHACGGMARHYPYARGWGKNDRTLDLDPLTKPDFLRDARDPFPLQQYPDRNNNQPWPGVLLDPPYSREDAAQYRVGASAYPSPNLLVRNALDVVAVGHKVGILHYLVPMCPKDARFVALITVFCGFNNKVRAFSVYEKIKEKSRSGLL